MIQGILATYIVDGKEKTFNHNLELTPKMRVSTKPADKTNNKSEKLLTYSKKTREVSISLEEFEHFEYIEATYSQRGLHSLKLRSNTGLTINTLGSAGLGHHRREIRLR